MTGKATMPTPQPAADMKDDGREAEVDGFVERDRDALNVSIGRSREEVARGVHSTRSIEDIVSDGRKRHRAG